MEAVDPVNWAPYVIVRPATPESFDHRDFADLTMGLVQQAELPADRIEFRTGYLYGNGVVEWTIVNFILDEAGRTAVDAVVTAIIAWAGRWLYKKRQREPDALPVKARILAPDGSVLREVEVKEPQPPDA